MPRSHDTHQQRYETDRAQRFVSQSTQGAAQQQRDAASPAFALTAARQGLANFLTLFNDETDIDLIPLLTGLLSLDLDYSSPEAFLESLLDGLSLITGIDFTRLIDINSALNPARLASNMWPLGIFPDAESISGQGIWDFDPYVTRTSDSSGSLHVTANGSVKAIRGVPTQVVPGQEVVVSVFVRWANYVGTGAPIQVHIIEYDNTLSRVDPKILGLAMLGTPVGPTVPTSDGWAEISGTYIVPVGVNEIRGRLSSGQRTVRRGVVRRRLGEEQAPGRLGRWAARRFQGGIARIQAFMDTLHNTLTGSTDFGHSLPELVEALKGIPADFVNGVLGPGSIGDTLENLWTKRFRASLTKTVRAQRFPTLRRCCAAWPLAGCWAGTHGRQLGVRTNRPLQQGLLRSERSNFSMGMVDTQFTVVPGTARSSSISSRNRCRSASCRG